MKVLYLNLSPRVIKVFLPLQLVFMLLSEIFNAEIMQMSKPYPYLLWGRKTEFLKLALITTHPLEIRREHSCSWSSLLHLEVE